MSHRWFQKTRLKIIRIINFIQLILHHNQKMSLK